MKRRNIDCTKKLMLFLFFLSVGAENLIAAASRPSTRTRVSQKPGKSAKTVARKPVKRTVQQLQSALNKLHDREQISEFVFLMSDDEFSTLFDHIMRNPASVQIPLIENGFISFMLQRKINTLDDAQIQKFANSIVTDKTKSINSLYIVFAAGHYNPEEEFINLINQSKKEVLENAFNEAMQKKYKNNSLGTIDIWSGAANIAKKAGLEGLEDQINNLIKELRKEAREEAAKFAAAKKLKPKGASQGKPVPTRRSKAVSGGGVSGKPRVASRSAAPRSTAPRISSAAAPRVRENVRGRERAVSSQAATLAAAQAARAQKSSRVAAAPQAPVSKVAVTSSVRKVRPVVSAEAKSRRERVVTPSTESRPTATKRAITSRQQPPAATRRAAAPAIEKAPIATGRSSTRRKVTSAVSKAPAQAPARKPAVSKQPLSRVSKAPTIKKVSEKMPVESAEAKRAREATEATAAWAADYKRRQEKEQREKAEAKAALARVQAEGAREMESIRQQRLQEQQKTPAADIPLAFRTAYELPEERGEIIKSSSSLSSARATESESSFGGGARDLFYQPLTSPVLLPRASYEPSSSTRSLGGSFGSAGPVTPAVSSAFEIEPWMNEPSAAVERPLLLPRAIEPVQVKVADLAESLRDFINDNQQEKNEYNAEYKKYEDYSFTAAFAQPRQYIQINDAFKNLRRQLNLLGHPSAAQAILDFIRSNKRDFMHNGLADPDPATYADAFNEVQAEVAEKLRKKQEEAQLAEEKARAAEQQREREEQERLAAVPASRGMKYGGVIIASLHDVVKQFVESTEAYKESYQSIAEAYPELRFGDIKSELDSVGMDIQYCEKSVGLLLHVNTKELASSLESLYRDQAIFDYIRAKGSLVGDSTLWEQFNILQRKLRSYLERAQREGLLTSGKGK